MSQMRKASPLWQDINQKLMSGGHIGSALQLVCMNHPEELIMVQSYKEILAKSPEGGCKKECNFILPDCDHPCPRLCHFIDADHTKVKCTQKCAEILCTFGHVCPYLCFQDCPDCEVPMEKQLPCGHTHSVPCAIQPENFKCNTKLNKELICKHVIRVPCHVNIEDFKCKEKCTTRLDCGHQCKRNCHVLDDPDHEIYDCHEPCEEYPENCQRNHKCMKKCYEDCGRCINLILRNLKCGHTLKDVACCIPEDEIHCPASCQRTLPCGHPCPKKCGDECGGCAVLVSKVVPECQHTIKVNYKTKFILILRKIFFNFNQLNLRCRFLIKSWA